MNLYVNALVDSYQDVDSKFLEELYNLAEVNDYENRGEIGTLLRSVATTDDSDFYKFQSRQATSFTPNFMLYSFWARRHHENNEEIVYDVLRQIQTRMDTIYGSLENWSKSKENKSNLRTFRTRQGWRKDAWNRVYKFTMTQNRKDFLITSAGPDEKFETEGDIKSK